MTKRRQDRGLHCCCYGKTARPAVTPYLRFAVVGRGPAAARPGRPRIINDAKYNQTTRPAVAQIETDYAASTMRRISRTRLLQVSGRRSSEISRRQLGFR